MVLLSPLFVVLGMHLALLSFGIRKYLRVPYLVALMGLHGVCLVPLWLPSWDYPRLAVTAVTVIVMLFVIVPVVIRGRDEVLEGGNIENTAPAHMVLVMAYLLLPAIKAAIKASNG